MRRLRSLLVRLATLFTRTRRERDLAAELDSHLQLHIDDNLRTGMSPAEARRQALLALGGVEQTKELVRDARGTFVDSVRQDVVFALRLMRRSPVVTGVAVLSLALGIGANTAIFSIINSVYLRTLPVREPERLVLLSSGSRNTSWSNPVWEEIQRRAELFEGACAWSPTTLHLTEPDQAALVEGLWVSGRFFDVLGVPVVLGRPLQAADDRRGGPGNPAVAVISHGFWQRRYGGAADVIGRALLLEHVLFTIVGVTPPGFLGPDVGRAFDVAIPIASDPLVRGRNSRLDQRLHSWLTVGLRLLPDQTAEAATAVLRGVQPQIREATRPGNLEPGKTTSYLGNPFTLTDASTGRSDLRDECLRPLVVLMIVVTLVLLTACVNVANLLVARVIARQHELSIRRALGASRLRLARQSFVESLLLSGSGTLLGTVVALWSSRLIVRQASSMASQITLDLSPDWHVLAFGGATCLATAMLFGMAPALRAARSRPNSMLQTPGGGFASHGRLRGASVLVAGQVALSLVLIVAAGLFVRTFSTLVLTSPGFDHDHVLVVNVNAGRSAARPAGHLDLFDRLRRAVGAVPGVARAGAGLVVPVSRSMLTVPVQVQGAPEAPADERVACLHVVGPDWFATLGMPILAGRDFTDRDGSEAPPVVIVNEAFVRRHRLDPNPLGRLVRTSGAEPGPLMEIVGVVGDAAYLSLRDLIPSTVYTPLAQTTFAPPFCFISVRVSRGSPSAWVRDVVAAMSAVDPNLAIAARPLSAFIDDSLRIERLMAMLSGFFGVLALLLAALGLYGVTSYTVNRRRAEIGIRMALGAAPGRMVRTVLARVAWLVGLGVMIGAAISLWAARFVESLLFGVKARDPLTFAGAAAVLVATALLAGWLPARRAARIDPATVLRES